MPRELQEEFRWAANMRERIARALQLQSNEAYLGIRTCEDEAARYGGIDKAPEGIRRRHAVWTAKRDELLLAAETARSIDLWPDGRLKHIWQEQDERYREDGACQ